MDWCSTGLIIPDFFGWVFFRGMGSQNGFKQEKTMSFTYAAFVLLTAAGFTYLMTKWLNEDKP